MNWNIELLGCEATLREVEPPLKKFLPESNRHVKVEHAVSAFRWNQHYRSTVNTPTRLLASIIPQSMKQRNRKRVIGTQLSLFAFKTTTLPYEVFLGLHLRSKYFTSHLILSVDREIFRLCVWMDGWMDG